MYVYVCFIAFLIVASIGLYSEAYISQNNAKQFLGSVEKYRNMIAVVKPMSNKIYMTNQHSDMGSSDERQPVNNQPETSSIPSPKKGFGGKMDPKIIVPGASIDQLLRQSTYQNLVKEYQSKSNQSRVFDDAIKFPCDFTVKIIGENDNSGLFVNDVVSKIAAIVGVTPESVKFSIKSSGSVKSTESKYLSVTTVVRYDDADQLYAVYDLASSDARIKYVI